MAQLEPTFIIVIIVVIIAMKSMFLYKRNRSNGYVHRDNAEKLIGRPLRRSEVVHHIDNNPENNSLENLMVFKTNADHVRYHGILKSGRTPKVFLDDGVYCTEKYVSVCEHCHKDFEPTTSSIRFCSLECGGKSRRKTNHPSPLDLHKLLWDKPTVQIAKDFGVSDKAVEKWAKKYNIPKPFPGFWRKVDAGVMDGLSCPLPEGGCSIR